MSKEAQARIKINKLLEVAGWRFFDDQQGKANITLEPNVKLTQAQVDAMGNDFETTSKGFIDFLLLDERGFPLLVLEAKAEGKNPLIGKEQARKYAKAQNCRFVILSNGNLHYLWDLNQGKLTFFRGQLLSPIPPGESKTPSTRYLDIREDAEIDEAQLVAWIQQASKLPGEKM